MWAKVEQFTLNDYKLNAPRAEIYIETNRTESQVEIISPSYIKAQMNFDERPSRCTRYTCVYYVYRVFISDVFISVAPENLRVKSHEGVGSFFVFYFCKTKPNHEIKMKSCFFTFRGPRQVYYNNKTKESKTKKTTKLKQRL